VRRSNLPAGGPQGRARAASATDLNADATVHGILVKRPLPDGLDAAASDRATSSAQGRDGLNSKNVSAIVNGEAGLRP